MAEVAANVAPWHPHPCCYAGGMSSKRITISVPAEVAKRIKQAAGRVPVSTWVTERIAEHLDQEELDRLFAEFYRDVKPAPASVREADAMFERLTGKRRGSGAA